MPCPRRTPQETSSPHPSAEAVGRVGKVSCKVAARRASRSEETGCERRIGGRRTDKAENKTLN